MRFVRPAPRRHRVGDGDHLLDEDVHEVGRGEEVRRAAGVVVEVGVQRDVLDMLEGVLEDLVLPAPEGRHVAAGRAAGGELDRGVDPAHHLRRLLGDEAVLRRRLVLHLPGAIHLVAEAPELDAVRRLVAVPAAQVRPGGAAGMVAVFEEVAGGVAGAGAEIDGEHRLDVRGPAPVDELVRPERVGLGREPGEVEPRRPFGDRADAVLPVVAGDEVAARVADDGGAELPDEIEHVAPEPALVRGRVAGLVDALVDAAPEMLDEGAEQARVGLADGPIAVEQHARSSHAGRLLVVDGARGRSAAGSWSRRGRRRLSGS